MNRTKMAVLANLLLIVSLIIMWGSVYALIIIDASESLFVKAINVYLWIDVLLILLLFVAMYQSVMVLSETGDKRFFINLLVSLGLLVVAGIVLYMIIMFLSGALGILWMYS